MSYDWHWRIIQDGFQVAGGVCPDRRRMEAEMSRYAVQYADEGPIRLETRAGKNKWKQHVP